MITMDRWISDTMRVQLPYAHIIYRDISNLIDGGNELLGEDPDALADRLCGSIPEYRARNKAKNKVRVAVKVYNAYLNQTRNCEKVE